MRIFLTLLAIISLTFFGFSQEIKDSILETIKRKSIESHSDAVIIKQHGKIIHKEYFGKEEVPIYVPTCSYNLSPVEART